MTDRQGLAPTDRQRLAWIAVVAVPLLGPLLGPFACGQPLPTAAIASVSPHQAYTDGPVVLLVQASGWRPRLNIDVGNGSLATDFDGLHVTLVPDPPDDRARVPLAIVKWDGRASTWVSTPAGLANGSYALERVDASGEKTSMTDAFLALGPDPGPPDIHIESPPAGTFIGAGTTFHVRGIVDDHLGGLSQIDWQTSDGSAGQCFHRPDDLTMPAPSSKVCDFNTSAPGLVMADPGVVPFSLNITATDVAGYQAQLEVPLHLAKLPIIKFFLGKLGAMGGYQPFIVEGQNFLPGTQALIGGVPIAGSPAGGNVVNDHSIIGWTPPHNRAEAVQVDVVSPAGTAPRMPVAFVYAPPPRPRDIQPPVGPARGGILVTITGNDLRMDVQIYIGGTTASRRPLFAPTYDPAHNKVVGCLPPGTGPASVWAYDPITGDGQLPNAFTYEEPIPGTAPPPIDPLCQDMPP